MHPGFGNAQQMWKLRAAHPVERLCQVRQEKGTHMISFTQILVPIGVGHSGDSRNLGSKGLSSQLGTTMNEGLK